MVGVFWLLLGQKVQEEAAIEGGTLPERFSLRDDAVRFGQPAAG